jgi:TPR repeat protein
VTQFEKHDYEEAMRWFRQSADQKYAPAQYQLGRMYASGFNTPEDKKEAVKWYLMSAEGGYKWAQIHLGELYMHFMAEQFGVKRDFNQAFYWLSLGTTTEEPSSDFVRDRDEAAGHLKPDEVETVKQRVDAWRAAHVPAAN